MFPICIEASAYFGEHAGPNLKGFLCRLFDASSNGEKGWSIAQPPRDERGELGIAIHLPEIGFGPLSPFPFNSHRSRKWWRLIALSARVASHNDEEGEK